MRTCISPISRTSRSACRSSSRFRTGPISEQIQRLERTGEAEKYVTIHAPMSGIIIQRNISVGHAIRQGEVLMTIADLTHVWGDADVYQSDLPYITVGMPLELSLPYWPDKRFRGKVIFVSPTLDPETRT